MNCGYCLEDHADAVELIPSLEKTIILGEPRTLKCPCCDTIYTTAGAHVCGPQEHRRAE